MKQAVKFTFDTQFGDASVYASHEKRAQGGQHEAELEKVRHEAYAAGFAAGEAEAEARMNRQVGDAMDELAANAASLLAALDAKAASMTAEAIALAFEAARKLAPALIETRPQTEIESVLRDCLSHLNREPHILLRISSSLVERLKETVDRMAMERGLSGRIILLGEPAMVEGNCVVEWADGGVVRDRNEIETEIGEIVARYIETITAPHGGANALAMPDRLAERE
jgi:flagellar assembly protein FliH